MYELYRITVTFTSVFLIFALGACQRPDENKLAEVNGTVITLQEVQRAGGRPLFQLNQQVYVLQRQKLDELIDERLLSEEAKERGISVDALLQQEVNAKVLPVTDEDILALYAANKDRIPVELNKVQGQIRDFLMTQRLTSQKASFIKSIRENAKVSTYLKPPVVYRVKLNTADAPSKGPDAAPVSIVKFEDFQCPYCKTIQTTYQELLKRYNGKIRLVHKDLPLDAIHPEARQAAEAARCAGEQAKFWEYHDKLYANSPKASVDELKRYAREVGLNVLAFDNCFMSRKYRSAVDKDSNEATELGINGTPTFFINGREMAGALPVESFASIIDEELGQAK